MLSAQCDRDSRDADTAAMPPSQDALPSRTLRAHRRGNRTGGHGWLSTLGFRSGRERRKQWDKAQPLPTVTLISKLDSVSAFQVLCLPGVARKYCVPKRAP